MSGEEASRRGAGSVRRIDFEGLLVTDSVPTATDGMPPPAVEPSACRLYGPVPLVVGRLEELSVGCGRGDGRREDHADGRARRRRRGG